MQEPDDTPEATTAQRRDYNEFAFRELRRARKAVGTDGKAEEAAIALQMAHVAALLDIADALRGLHHEK